MSEASEAIRAKLRADYDRIQALPPDERSRVEHERQREATALADETYRGDTRTIDEILSVGQTPASRRERAEAAVREAPGKAKAAADEAARIAHRDESMKAHAPKPAHELTYPYMQTDFPKESDQ